MVAGIFLVYVLRDHSVILRKCTPDGGVVRLHVKEGYFFTPPKGVTSPIWGPPPSCKQALKHYHISERFQGATKCGKFSRAAWELNRFCVKLETIGNPIAQKIIS